MKYNIDSLKKIDIVSWLDKQGYKKQRGGTGKYVSYYSMIGKEENASFKVNTNTNRWQDYHSQSGGDIIDLLRAINKCSFNDACKALSDDTDVEIKTYSVVKKADGVKIHSVKELTDVELFHYMTQVRKISEHVLSVYTKEVSFSFPYSKKDPDRVYTAVGFQTGKESFELRNSWMKVAAGCKHFSTIRGTDEKDLVVDLHEAWIDYLSFLTHHGVTKPKNKTHILNGAGLINVLNPFLEKKTVYAYVDADRAGDKIIESMDKSNVIDMRNEFGFYSDYNAWLQNNY